ncbi:C4-dicarboxylate ABC transporter substrate-binding protein [Oceanobacillus oncorhynchi subsp. incaldanensis]|uniref:TRAP transporter substrate-binding protein n=1 Tax=Oceanobacillus oncorhynchi TaxID=545501 RepID=UPI001B23163A|nr:TRAP transporter substrate-binding protein [Oceanobacillus oncorhynchi]GIO20354.1 C4-dicarboxylate ABC transporter substrate-binding protein [Oceanobacillus oncorhynchi subsp. incaldanensis]
MKKNLGILIISFFILVLTACGFEEPSENEGNANGEKDSEEVDQASTEAEIVFDMSLPEGPGTKNDAGAQAFKEKLEDLSGGEMSVNIHYSNAFGGEREVYEMMGQNSLDMALQSSGPMGVFDERMFVFDLPYLFRDSDHARGVLDGEIGDELAEIFEEAANVKVLSWVENGFVVVGSTGTEIRTVEDFEGFQIRVQESSLQIDTWEAVGADPTPMAWPEVFTSLQQGVIDGHDQAIMVLETGNFYDVQDAVTILDARFVAAPISISADRFDSLTSEQQEIVQEAAEYGRDKGRERIDEMYESSKEFLGDEGGLEIIEFSQEEKDKYREMTQSVYDDWGSVIGEDLIERIENHE